MIQKKNIALVIDTNILGDIIATENSENVVIILKEWLLKIIANMEKQPKGKKITVFASINTLHDYRTGLIKAGYKNTGKTISLIFGKSLSQKTTISKSQKIDLSLKKIKVDVTKPKKRVKDKNDENFLVLSEAITQIKNWKDREIIFASRDRQSTSTIKNIFLKSSHNSRLHVATDLKSFEKLIEC